MRSVCLVLTLAACGPPAAPTPSDDVPASLHAAHTAWVAGDLPTLTEAVHSTLAADPSPDVAHNAIGLLDVALSHHTTLPTGQALPEGVRRLSLNHIHRSGPDGHRYRLVVSALLDHPERLDDLRLVGPDLTADRRTATWTLTPEEDGHYLELELPDTPAPAQAGLYTLHLESASATASIWTVLPPLSAAEPPVVTQPRPGQVLPTAIPTVAVDPTSIAPHIGGLGVWIARVPTYAGVWSTWRPTPLESVTVDAPLPDDRYWLAVSARTTRYLGPVTLGQVERRGVPFEVDTK